MKIPCVSCIFEYFLMFLRFFSNNFYDFVELEPDANEGKSRQQNTTNGDGAEVGGRGPDAGVQVSVATQRTCTSNHGTGVCITSSPRHDGSDGSRQW
jgi:hypothetical protein